MANHTQQNSVQVKEPIEVCLVTPDTDEIKVTIDKEIILLNSSYPEMKMAYSFKQDDEAIFVTGYVVFQQNEKWHLGEKYRSIMTREPKVSSVDLETLKTICLERLKSCFEIQDCNLSGN